MGTALLFIELNQTAWLFKTSMKTHENDPIRFFLLIREFIHETMSKDKQYAITFLKTTA
jgi:hypothetical protein